VFVDRACWKRILAPPVIIALTAGIAITLLQFWLNAPSSAIRATPHHVPIAVVGSPPAVHQLPAQVRRGDARTVRAARNEAEAIVIARPRVVGSIERSTGSGQARP
jgi:hypothetical protein